MSDSGGNAPPAYFELVGLGASSTSAEPREANQAFLSDNFIRLNNTESARKFKFQQFKLISIVIVTIVLLIQGSIIYVLVTYHFSQSNSHDKITLSTISPNYKQDVMRPNSAALTSKNWFIDREDEQITVKYQPVTNDSSEEIDENASFDVPFDDSTSLRIDLSDSFDWAAGLESISGRIQTLYISECTNLETLHAILTKIKEIRKLVIEFSNHVKSNCKRFDTATSVYKTETLLLSDLVIANFVECMEIFDFLRTIWNVIGVNNLELKNASLATDGVERVRKFIGSYYQSLSKLELLDITTTYPSTPEYSKHLLYLPNLLELTTDPFVFPSYLFKDSVKQVFPNLRLLHFRNGYIPLSFLRFILELTKLLSLETGIQIPSKVNYVDLTSIASKLQKLERLKLNLQFSTTQSICQVAGVDALLKTLKVCQISGNCKLSRAINKG